MPKDPSSGFLVPLAWLVALLSASILYRRSQGKPVLFFGVHGAKFLERAASGHANDTWYTRLGGASHCLIVAVASGTLIVRPHFPFNLLFLPEIYRLEHVVPLEHIIEATEQKSIFGGVVLVRFRDEQLQERSVTLRVKDAVALVRCLTERAS